MLEDNFQLPVKIIYKPYLFYFIIVAFLAAIIVRSVFNYNIPVWSLLIFPLLLCITGDRDAILATAIMCMPLTKAFQFKYALLICILVLLLKYWNDFSFTYAHMILFICMIWEFFHFILGRFELTLLLRDFAELLLLAVFVGMRFKKWNYPKIIRVYCFSVVTIGLSVLYNAIRTNSFLSSNAIEQGYRLGIGNVDVEVFGLNFNPNELGFLCILGICGLVQLIVANKQVLYDYFVLIVLLFLGVQTLARSFLVCLVAIILMFIYLISKNVVDFIKISFITVLSFMLINLFFYSFLPYVYDNFMLRLMASDISNGRIYLFELYNSILLDNPLNFVFGFGLQNFFVKIAAEYGVIQVPHNGIQEIFLVWGVVGFILLVCFFYSLYKDILYKTGTLHLINIMPLLLLFIMVQFGQFLRGACELLCLTFCYISCLYNFDCGD